MNHGPLARIGLSLIVLGILFLAAAGLARLGWPLGRLPGDISVRGKHFAFYAPIATCLLSSVVLTLLFWLVSHFRR
ncbi:DUF2905 domain-containing protein [Acidicapsa acidisoli]|uniref:DUF2905 domain-containing protein n=1 Tax=Acidicapsa acidisoli TaxID=1615681 RepID=UPI0021E045E6|nr:DUF2905 domain-containing protein [Acidicapsa acidisoli]